MKITLLDISKFVYAWGFIFAIWLAFTTTFELSEVLVGLVASFVISFFSMDSFSKTGLKSLAPKKILYTIQYGFVFFVALIKSNLHVAKIVISPKLKINPGIVEFETKLESDFAKMLLANSITLTPGTLSVDIVDNRLFIHWLEVSETEPEKVYKEIAQPFEKILLKIYN